MPAVAAHYYFGQEVLKLLPKEIKRVVNKNKQAFDLGLQGPDIFFYYKPLKKNEIVELGHEIHKQPGNCIISNAVKKLRENPDEEASAYLLGFVCHFVLDSGVHGSISEIAADTAAHKLLEAEIDRQIIEKIYHKKPEKFKRHELIKIDTGNYGWLQLIYPEISVNILKKCVKGFAFYTKLLYSRGSVKRSMIMLGEKAFHKENEFSSMMINRQGTKGYYKGACGICIKINELREAGKEAVLNTYSCLEEGNNLFHLFYKNFL